MSQYRAVRLQTTAGRPVSVSGSNDTGRPARHYLHIDHTPERGRSGGDESARPQGPLREIEKDGKRWKEISGPPPMAEKSNRVRSDYSPGDWPAWAYLDCAGYALMVGLPESTFTLAVWSCWIVGAPCCCETPGGGLVTRCSLVPLAPQQPRCDDGRVVYSLRRSLEHRTLNTDLCRRQN